MPTDAPSPPLPRELEMLSSERSGDGPEDGLRCSASSSQDSEPVAIWASEALSIGGEQYEQRSEVEENMNSPGSGVGMPKPQRCSVATPMEEEVQAWRNTRFQVTERRKEICT